MDAFWPLLFYFLNLFGSRSALITIQLIFFIINRTSSIYSDNSDKFTLSFVAFMFKALNCNEDD